MALTNNLSDKIGVFASITCMVHCAITPLIFIANLCSLSCCSQAPLWWRSLDYIFLGITFIAIIQSNKAQTLKIIKWLFGVSWVLLAFFIVNESVMLFSITHHLKYIPALAIVFLHMYNMRTCRCQGDKCCAYPHKNKM
tara:strand:+ start:2719 stop:3135 length:417 start_codon:yes stop_codon:yes gene_type:complete